MTQSFSRRNLFRHIAGAAPLVSSSTTAFQQKRHGKLKVAAVYTAFTHRSHANVILENFLEPSGAGGYTRIPD
jgi:hypothetical protein